MDLSAYESRIGRPVRKKLPELSANGRLKHLIFSEQLDRPLMAGLFTTADAVRDLSADAAGAAFLQGLLRHKKAMLYFTQTSTRTFLSFVAACQTLGLSVAEIRDPSLSSEYKGESPLDSMRMFSSYFDLIVMRDKTPRFAESCAYLMNDLDGFNQRNIPIVNGGSGADEHPTQALLDLYTIERSFKFESTRDSSRWTRYEDLRSRFPDLRRGIEGKRFAFVGDIGRGRTVRSLATLLSRYPGIEMHFVAPDIEGLRLPLELKDKLVAAGAEVYEHASIDAVLGDVDLLYMTRVQHEHDKDGGAAVDWSDYVLTTERVARMREYAPIMHPFPRNDEIPTEVDVDPRAMYFRQARNGMWVRSALLAHLFDMEAVIQGHHRATYGDYHHYNESVL